MTAQIDVITIYIALATIGNFLLLFLNLLMFAFLLKKIRNLTRDETAFNSKYTKIISEANDQATLILNKATKESEAMINELFVQAEKKIDFYSGIFGGAIHTMRPQLQYEFDAGRREEQDVLKQTLKLVK